MIQILLTILFSSFKFAATFPLVVLKFRFSFAETLLWTNLTKFLYLIGSNIIWSVIYMAFYMFWDELLLNRA